MADQLITHRLANASDFDELGQLVFTCVRTGPSTYSDEQRAAWMPAPRSGPEWAERLSTQWITLAESNSQIVGFMSFVPETGYLDFAYILPHARGQGLFASLYAALEKQALKIGVEKLWVHASLMAHPAFEAHGFEVISPEEVRIGEQTLKRYLMEKALV
ncbi:MAG: hypothetical protein CMK07_05745 [Ponticaulis sp.]|nr:hypothetical protein [Ponticaulis sp.]